MEKTYARKIIKAQAWGDLRGNWLKSFVAMLLQSVFALAIFSLLPIRIPDVNEIMNVSGDTDQMLHLFMPGAITSKTIGLIITTTILYLLVISPFSIGLYRFYLKVAKGEKGKFSDVFSVYTSLKTVFSSVWLSLLVFFISSFWTAVFMLIPIVLMMCASMLNSTILFLVSIVLVPVACLFTALWISRYRFASYIFAEGKLSAFASLRECISLLGGRTKECLVLRASYLLWDVVAANIAPLSLVYSALSGTVYAKYLSHFRGEMFLVENNIPPAA